MNLRSIAVCAALVAVGACGPDDYVLPPPDTSLDPARLSVGTLLYACGKWNGAPPTDAHVLVDVFFGRRSAADPPDKPRQESLQGVADRGGQVVFTFPFPAARVWIETARVPSLVNQYVASFVTTVPDPARYDWEISVGLTQGPGQADLARFEELGGRVNYMWPAMHGFAGYLPSRSVPLMRAWDDVVYVEASGWGCLE